MSLEIINARLDLVSHFRNYAVLRGKIIGLLKRSHDSQRLVQKFSMGRGDADDLISLLRTIEATSEISNALIQRTDTLRASNETKRSNFDFPKSLLKLSRRLSLEGPGALAHRIVEALDEEGLTRSTRIEEYENANMVSLAQKIVLDEGSADEQDALPKTLKSKVANRASNEQDIEDEEVWIMRKG